MPNYDFICPAKHTREIFCSIAEKPDILICPDCGDVMEQFFPYFPGLHTDDYWSSNNKFQNELLHNGVSQLALKKPSSPEEKKRLAATPIHDKKTAFDVMRSKGIEMWDKGVSKDAKQNKKYKEERRDKERREVIESAYKEATTVEI